MYMLQPNTVLSSSTIALGLAEIIDRLTVEEKREFVKIIDWDELQRLRVEIAQDKSKNFGEPRVYIGTTEAGLSLELPMESVLPFINFLPRILNIDEIEIFILDNRGSKEYRCAASELKNFLEEHLEAIREGSIMIEFGPHTLVSGGGGCLSLALENVPKATVKEIARKALELCGFEYQFRKEKFSAIVWENLLEVKE
jgi:hypothetical protein